MTSISYLMRRGCEASASVGRKTQNLAPLTSGTKGDTPIGMRKMGLWKRMWALLTCITIRKVSHCSIFCLAFTHVLVWYVVSSFHAIPTKSGSKTITTVNNHHNKDRRSMSSIKNNSSLCKSDSMVCLSLRRWFITTLAPLRVNHASHYHDSTMSKARKARDRMARSTT